MTLSWSNYRSLPDTARQYQECTPRCRPAFEHRRRNLSKVIAATRPKTVAVLGAGVLNDDSPTAFPGHILPTKRASTLFSLPS